MHTSLGHLTPSDTSCAPLQQTFSSLCCLHFYPLISSTSSARVVAPARTDEVPTSTPITVSTVMSYPALWTLLHSPHSEARLRCCLLSSFHGGVMPGVSRHVSRCSFQAKQPKLEGATASDQNERMVRLGASWAEDLKMKWRERVESARCTRYAFTDQQWRIHFPLETVFGITRARKT